MNNFIERCAAGEMICKVCGEFSSSQTCWKCIGVMQMADIERDANVGHWQFDTETGEWNFVYGVITNKE